MENHSGLAGINIADALKLLPADAVEKVEVLLIHLLVMMLKVVENY